MSPRRLGGLLDPTGLVAYWPLDSDPLDKSGNARDGTEQNMVRINQLLQAYNLNSASWTKSATTGTALLNAVGIYGLANTASTLTDSDDVNYYLASQNKTIPNDSNTHTAVVFILKDSNQARFPQVKLVLSGGTGVTKAVAVNTATGVIRVVAGCRMIDGALYEFPEWWILELTAANNSTGNVTASVQIYAAAGPSLGVDDPTVQGSVVIGHVELNLNSQWFVYPPIPTTTAAVTVNATYINGRIDKALSFDGLNDHLWVAGGVAALKWTGQDFSYGGWIQVDQSEVPDTGYIISKPWNGSGQYNYQVYVNVNRSIGVSLVGDVTPFVLTTAAGVVTPGKWNHVFVTVESSTKIVRIYVDGRLVATGTHTITNWVPTLTDTNERLALGTLYPYGPGWVGVAGHAFCGRLEELRIYSRVLTADELSQHAALYVSIASDNAEIVHLLEFQFDTGTVRIATSGQDLSWNSLSWEAVGGLLELGGIEETTDARGQGIDLRLSGVDQTILSVLINSKYRGRVVKIWRAHLDRTTGRVVGTMLLFQGLQLSAYTVDEERDNGGGTVRISTRISGYFGVERVRGIMSNLVSHQHYYSGDLFFQHSASLANVKIYWGTPVPRTPGSSSGGDRGRTCFPAGTQVLLWDGTTRSIETVRLGDMVAAFDQNDGTPCVGQVVGCMQHIAKELLVLTTSKRILAVTPEHLVYSGEGVFVAAGDLPVGGELWCREGDVLVVEEIVGIEILPSSPTIVYNLEVETHHTYVANGVAVHNLKANDPL